jgi:20S proteasome alpha/beta subunit
MMQIASFDNRQLPLPPPDWYYLVQRGSVLMTLAIALSGADSIVMATDSRETQPEFDTNGRMRIRWKDDVPKLFGLNDYVGVVFASTVAGYEQWAVDLFNETVTDKSSKSFRQIVGAFAQMLKNDLYRYIDREHAKAMLGSGLEFVFGGYNSQGKPEIAKIRWTPIDQQFTPQPVSSCYYATGAPAISDYLAEKVKHCLPNMSTASLQRLATLLITETSTTERTVDDNVQMAVIGKGRKLQFVSTSEIEKLKSEVGTIIGKDRLLSAIIEGN